MMKSVELMNSATTPEAPAFPAGRVESVAHGTPCVVRETAAAMVRRGIPSLIMALLKALIYDLPSGRWH